MLSLDLAKISTQAEDKSDTELTLTPEVYVLILHLLSLLSDNQWFFLDPGDDERELTDKAFEEFLP